MQPNHSFAKHAYKELSLDRAKPSQTFAHLPFWFQATLQLEMLTESGCLLWPSWGWGAAIPEHFLSQLVCVHSISCHRKFTLAPAPHIVMKADQHNRIRDVFHVHRCSI
jgi:hypothetical protein